MPELPEVEVVRRGLDPVVRGRTIVDVRVTRDRAVRREPGPEVFAAALTGCRVEGTGRVGKYLVVDTGPDAAVVIHLGMSGQLRVARPSDVAIPHTHVVWSLDDGHEVRFVDPRTFGQMFRSVVPSSGARPVALSHLGPDALTELEPDRLASALAARRVRLKLRLMDQTAIAGLGNIYTDEVLFRAGVAGSRPAGSLTDPEVERLVTACRSVLTAAIAAGGSSLADAQYVDVFGVPGRYQRVHAVHAREGRPCPACGLPIVRERYGDRSGYGCPRCQT
jgi:formamidopyrimidine-DNA glycosylase